MGRPSKDATPCALLDKSVQVLVTTDWKMKILSAFFRENQALFEAVVDDRKQRPSC
jgi:hypothetical protein